MTQNRHDREVAIMAANADESARRRSTCRLVVETFGLRALYQTVQAKLKILFVRPFLCLFFSKAKYKKTMHLGMDLILFTERPGQRSPQNSFHFCKYFFFPIYPDTKPSICIIFFHSDCCIPSHDISSLSFSLFLISASDLFSFITCYPYIIISRSFGSTYPKSMPAAVQIPIFGRRSFHTSCVLVPIILVLPGTIHLSFR